jgi:bacteriocin-like protein
METLKDLKFEPLTVDEMQQIDGGKWGWHVVDTDISSPDGITWCTTVIWAHYNIFVKKNDYDVTQKVD